MTDEDKVANIAASTLVVDPAFTVFWLTKPAKAMPLGTPQTGGLLNDRQASDSSSNWRASFFRKGHKDENTH